MKDNPIISVDSKKKEILGQLTRNEKVLSQAKGGVEVYDHVYPCLGTGKVIPHGIYDVKLNKADITQ